MTVTRLTDRQQMMLTEIQTWIQEYGYPPTIRELGKRTGIKSLRGVTTHLDAMAKKGYLQRARGGARGIRLLVESAARAVEATIRLPVLGRIAAGQPLLAEEHVEGHLAVDASLLGQSVESRRRDHFALQVHGESMQGAGILDGDYVIVRQQPAVDNGDIVVVLIGDEATVKRMYRENDHIRLQPEHPTMEPIILTKRQSASILGKVIAVFRRLP